MMKKVSLTFIFIFSLLIFPTPLTAQQNGMMEPGLEPEKNINNSTTQIYPVPPYRDNPTQILGQDQAYSVTFRGNGEAVVSAKVVFTNLTDNSLDSVSLRVPKVDPQDVIVFQVLRERACIGGYRQQSPDAIPGTPLVCGQYQEPDYYGYYGNSKYQKARSELHGDTIDITLPQRVNPNASGAFLIYYRAFGYARKNLVGAYNFTFETLKVEDKIRDLTVGISTDSDLILKGAKGNVNYRFEAGMMAMKSSDSGVAMANPQIDQYYQQIGYGTITKKASNLQPLDSYSVKGAYADNSLRLYGKEISIALLVFLGCLAFFILLGKKTFSWLSSRKQEVDNKGLGMSIITTAGLGFVTSVCILLYSVGLMVINVILRQMLGYSESQFIVYALLVMISIAIYGLLIFVPSIIVGVKKGLAWGLGTFVATVIWLVIDLIFTFIILFFFFGFQNRSIMSGGTMRLNIDKSSEATQQAPLPPDAAFGNQTK